MPCQKLLYSQICSAFYSTPSDPKAGKSLRRERRKEEALGLKDRLEAFELVFSMPAGSNGKLFGAVTNGMIAEGLGKEEIVIERKKIEIPDRTIKMVGTHTVKVRLYDHQTASLKVTIKNEQEKEKTGDSKKSV